MAQDLQTADGRLQRSFASAMCCDELVEHEAMLNCLREDDDLDSIGLECSERVAKPRLYYCHSCIVSQIINDEPEAICRLIRTKER